MDLETLINRHTDRLFGEGGQLKVAASLAFAAAHLAGATWAKVPYLYQLAIGLLMLDWLTGTTKALITKTANSDAGKQGIVKSVFYLGFLFIADIGGRMGTEVAHSAPVPFQFFGLLTSCLPFFAFVAVGHTETNSTLENFRDIAKHYGKQIPPLEWAIEILRLKPDAMLPAIQAVAKGAMAATGPLNTQTPTNEKGAANAGKTEQGDD